MNIRIYVGILPNEPDAYSEWESGSHLYRTRY